MAMTSDDWLAAVKTGLGIQHSFHDPFLTQKINAVKDYLSGAGVMDEQMETPLGIDVVTLGVKDLWNNVPGSSTYSSAFHSGLETLKVRSLPDASKSEDATNTGNIGEGF